MILGALDYLGLTYPLDACLSCLIFILDGFLGASVVSLGTWETSLVVEVKLILIIF
jgi:hypothetical protein